MTSSGHSLGTTRTSDRRVSISPTPSHWGLPSPPPPLAWAVTLPTDQLLRSFHPTIMPSDLPQPPLTKERIQFLRPNLWPLFTLYLPSVQCPNRSLPRVDPISAMMVYTEPHGTVSDLNLFAASLSHPQRTNAFLLCAQVRTFTMLPANTDYRCVPTCLLIHLHPSQDKAP